MGSATPVGLLPTVMLSAAEGTAQVPTAGIPGVSKKANAAMATGNRAVLEVRIAFQDRVQRDLILTNQRVGAIVLVPILRKGENLLEGDDEKARFSVMIWSVLFTPSSYLLDANASRGRTKFFRGLDFIIQSSHRYNRSSPFLFTRKLCLNSMTTWKEKGIKQLLPFFFPSSDSF